MDWRVVYASLILAFVTAGFYFYYGNGVSTVSCSPVQIAKDVEGSQGYRIWNGEALKSFEHNGENICVPEGWAAVDPENTGQGWAQFEKERTGVIIRKEAFSEMTLRPPMANYDIHVLYLKDARVSDVSAYSAMITSAFDKVSALYGEKRGEKTARLHTVLITAGIAGDTVKGGTRVYPDPGKNLTIIVRKPNQYRSEELYIHAVAHLFNRYRDDLSSYIKNQQPFDVGGWEEMESAWAEIALNSNKAGRESRLAYLSNVHRAVMTKNFSLISQPPFNDKTAFEKITPSVFVSTAGSYLDVQYGHYVLAPLVMVGTDMLLRKHDVTLAEVLLRVHVDGINFYSEIESILSKKEFMDVQSWVEGKSQIPNELIQKASVAYQ